MRPDFSLNSKSQPQPCYETVLGLPLECYEREPPADYQGCTVLLVLCRTLQREIGHRVNKLYGLPTKTTKRA